MRTQWKILAALALGVSAALREGPNWPTASSCGARLGDHTLGVELMTAQTADVLARNIGRTPSVPKGKWRRPRGNCRSDRIAIDSARIQNRGVQPSDSVIERSAGRIRGKSASRASHKSLRPRHHLRKIRQRIKDQFIVARFDKKHLRDHRSPHKSKPTTSRTGMTSNWRRIKLQ